MSRDFSEITKETINALFDDLDFAADRIKELEADLKQSAWTNEMLVAANINLRKKTAELEAGIRSFMSGHYSHPRSYRPENCPHDINYWTDCQQCDDEHFDKLLGDSDE